MATPEAWMQLGAVGVLGFILVLVIRWLLANVTRELRDVSVAIRTLALIQLDTHKTLIMHDAQIRGVNPSAGKDMTDAHEKARDEYEKVLRNLDGTIDLIKSQIASVYTMPQQ